MGLGKLFINVLKKTDGRWRVGSGQGSDLSLGVGTSSGGRGGGVGKNAGDRRGLRGHQAQPP